MTTPVYADLASLPEEARIKIIGEHAESGKLVAFVTDDDAKADRYIRKLLLDYHVQVVERGMGPVKNTVYVKIGPA